MKKAIAITVILIAFICYNSVPVTYSTFGDCIRANGGHINDQNFCKCAEYPLTIKK